MWQSRPCFQEKIRAISSLIINSDTVNISICYKNLSVRRLKMKKVYLQPEIERYDFKADVIMASGLGAPLGLDGVLSGTDIDW